MTPNGRRPRRGNDRGANKPHGGEAERRVTRAHSGAAPAVDEEVLPSTVALPRTSGGKPRTKTYVYCDATGSPVLLVNRFEDERGKTFTQGHVDAGRYRPGKGDHEPVPYRLEALLRTATEGGKVYIVEGEKDALALEARGYVATCNAGGAGKWRPEFAEHFVGVNAVVIVFDRDPKGRAHALGVERSLRDVVPTIRFRRAAEGNDLSDHLAAGLSLAELVRARPRAPRSAPPQPVRRRRSELLDTILAQLEAVTPVGEQAWTARCPVASHRDANPSFSVAVGESQPVVVYCHAGCSPEEIAAALGLPVKALCSPRRPAGDLAATPLSDIEVEQVRWLWEGKIPLAKVAVIDGDPEQGKSLVTADIAARLSTGRPMPSCGGPGRVGVTLLISAEDDAGDTIRPRVEVAGGDLSKVHVVDLAPDEHGYRKPLFIPDDLPQLEVLIRETGALLVVLDPLSAFLNPGINSHNDASVRQALTPLTQVAQRTGAAVVLVRHLNKTAGSAAIYRGGGSIGVVGASRSALLIATSRTDPTRRVLAPVKANLVARAAVTALEFRVVEREGQPVIDWIGPATETADELVAKVDHRKDSPERDAAADFLTELLAQGPMRMADVLAAAAGVHSKTTLYRAAEGIGVVKRKLKAPDGRVQWWEWSLGEDGP